MSRAYCLTCNEQVHETPGGTCPQGHPVTANDHGPEPWVGFAAVDERHEVPMDRIDASGRQFVHAGARANGHVNGHATGHVRSSTLLDGHGHTNGNGLGPADHDEAGHAADDLAALLAQALEQEQDAPTPDPGPVDLPTAPAPDATASRADQDWSELAGLAAELQLDAHHADQAAPDHHTADHPAAHHPVDDPAPIPGADPSETPDLDALLAELTGSAEAGPEPASPPTTQAPPAPPPPPAAPPAMDPLPAPDPAPGFEDVPSPAPVDEATSPWDEPTAPVEDEPPAPPVDLTNFTARGTRVGGGGGRPARSRRRKKE